MYKKVKLAGIISTLILSASAYSAEMTVGFSQIGSESGWRAAETSVAKTEAQKRGITLKIADLKKFEAAVNNAVKIPLNQNQFDALVSLAYNIGTNAFSKSTLVKKLNANDIRGAADQFDVWVNAGGKRMQGLVNRRAREKALFIS